MPSLSQAGVDVVVVGGGLAGLTASVLLARGGKRVTLVERSPQLGGRALTQRQDGFSLNLGPHALYRGGHAVRVLRTLGIKPRGGIAPTRGFAGIGSEYHVLPSGAGSLLKTRLLSPGQKLHAMRVLAGLPFAKPEALAGKTVSEWLRPLPAEVAALVATFVRLSSYANAPDRQDAAAALKQLAMSVRAGTLYLDGGWLSMVEALTEAAANAGVKRITGNVTRVVHEAGVQGVEFATGETLAAPTVLLALPPAQAARLVDERARGPLQHWSDTLIPVQAACLDLALRRLPRPEASFALGIDRPWYVSVHSGVAKLAPTGGAVLHAAWYLDPERPASAAEISRDLEEVLDRLQPGWRDEVVIRRFMPHLTVSNALDTPAGRPEPDASGIPGLYVAGDWVGSAGMLADASLASAEQAATLILSTPTPAIHPTPAPLS